MVKSRIEQLQDYVIARGVDELFEGELEAIEAEIEQLKLISAVMHDFLDEYTFYRAQDGKMTFLVPVGREQEAISRIPDRVWFSWTEGFVTIVTRVEGVN